LLFPAAILGFFWECQYWLVLFSIKFRQRLTTQYVNNILSSTFLMYMLVIFSYLHPFSINCRKGLSSSILWI